MLTYSFSHIQLLCLPNSNSTFKCCYLVKLLRLTALKNDVFCIVMFTVAYCMTCTARTRTYKLTARLWNKFDLVVIFKCDVQP